MKEKRLGKGLDALIPRVKGEEEEKNLIFLSPHSIVPGQAQSRLYFDEERLGELAESIKEKGILQPVVVRKIGEGKYELIAGERRWRAAKLAGVKKIPALVREVSLPEAQELSLIENLQREDLNPIEEAKCYQSLLSLLGITQEKLAQRIGKSRPAIANSLRLLELPPLVQEALIKGDILEGQARALLGLPEEKQLFLLEEIKKKKRGREKGKDPEILNLERLLSEKFGTKVTIHPGKKKGKIEIEYYSEEDLKRILEVLG